MLPMSEVLSIKWTPERRSKLREIRGRIPLVDIASRLNEVGVEISRQYLYKIETSDDVKGVSPEIIEGLAIVLGVSVTELLCLDSRLIVLPRVDI
ncbi:MAG: helix-turn-helix transcriptional regulator [Scytonematopsis contorta HA4267-MV1]|nr:helix-turn-helix transcriptional regulator [Scytonematopsis contorta HA4267-MV1]